MNGSKNCFVYQISFSIRKKFMSSIGVEFEFPTIKNCLKYKKTFRLKKKENKVRSEKLTYMIRC